MVSYQCSQHSTPESIKEVFQLAQNFQEKARDSSRIVSVVVLDEVGLAEDSPQLPLKALHPLLEDGTQHDMVRLYTVFKTMLDRGGHAVEHTMFFFVVA